MQPNSCTETDTAWIIPVEIIQLIIYIRNFDWNIIQNIIIDLIVYLEGIMFYYQENEFGTYL